jgi:hypothetical protein
MGDALRAHGRRPHASSGRRPCDRGRRTARDVEGRGWPARGRVDLRGRRPPRIRRWRPRAPRGPGAVLRPGGRARPPGLRSSRALRGLDGWESSSGERYLRGGPGSLLFIPPGCPHAFSNPAAEPARVLFQAAPSGHEDYLDELAALLREARGKPDPAAVAELRRRYDIEQLTPLRNPPGHAHAGPAD